MTIKEFLKDYYALDGPFSSIYQTMKNIQLWQDFALWAGSDKTLYWLFKILTRFGNTSIHPDKAVSLCASMGITTWEELLNYAEKANETSFDGAGMYDYLNPTIDVSRFTKTATSADIQDLIVRAGLQSATPNMDDSENFLIPDDMVDEIFDKCDSDRFGYITNKRDCDDFSRVVRGQTSRWGIGNMLLGTVHASFYWDEELKGRHSFLIAVGESGTIYFRDGQDDNIKWQGADPVVGLGGINRMGQIEYMRF